MQPDKFISYLHVQIVANGRAVIRREGNLAHCPLDLEIALWIALLVDNRKNNKELDTTR